MGDTATATDTKETPENEPTVLVRFRGFLLRVMKRAGGVCLLIVGLPAFISGLILFLLGLVIGSNGAFLSERGADLLGIDSSYFEDWFETRAGLVSAAS